MESNSGKGAALSAGFSEALSAGFSTVVTLDADLQHNPALIPALLDNSNKFDIVIGNRLGDTGKMPVQRIVSNKLTSFLLTKKTGTLIQDSQCGFRAYRREVLTEIKTVYSGFEAESEILVKAARKNYKIGFVNIPAIYGNEKSKMKAVEAIKGFIKVMLS